MNVVRSNTTNTGALFLLGELREMARSAEDTPVNRARALSLLEGVEASIREAGLLIVQLYKEGR